MTTRPRLYFSFRSPYSWLAVHRLREAVPDLFQVLDLVPYWSPEERTARELERRGGRIHYTEMSRAKRLYLLPDVKRLADRAGLPVVWPSDAGPRWDLPHLAWLLARRMGRPAEFYDALVEARWGRGECVWDPGVVRRAASCAGIDPDLVLAAPEDPEVWGEAVGCLYQAHLDSVFGVPYLKWGRHRFWGFDRLDVFLEIWPPAERGGPRASAAGGIDYGDLCSDLPAELLDEGYAYDDDCAGGCG